MTVGERLKDAREKLGKSQADIADELGIKQPSVSSWESGHTRPRKDLIRDVAKAYGIDPMSLLPEFLPGKKAS